MRYGVDEGVVLLVTTELSYQKSRIQNHAADDQAKQQHAKKHQYSGMPFEQNPTDIEKQDESDDTGAKGNEKRD